MILFTPTTLTATQIIAQEKAALGKLIPGSYILVWHSHGGGIDKTITVKHDNHHASITTEQHGAFTTASGVVGGTHWDQDENGIVRVETNFRATEDPNTLAYEHPEDPQYNVKILGLTDSQPAEYEIEINPPGGDDEFLYYSAATKFLDRDVTFEKDRHRHETDYSEYRQDFGLYRATRITTSDGRPQNDETSDLISVAVDSDPRPLTMPTSRPLFDPPAAPVTLPARFTTDGIIIRLTVAGQGLDFVLDSGSSSLLLDPGVATKLGLTMVGRTTDTIGGDFDQSQTRIPEVSIGPLQMHDVAFDVGPMNQETGDARIVGLLGCDFIANSILGLDFKKGTLTIYPRATFDPVALGVQAFPVDVDDCVPRVKATIENVEGSFLVDTGAFASIGYRNYMNKLPSVSSLGQKGRFEAVGGDVSAKIETASDFIFGGLHVRSVQLIVPTESTFDIAQYDGIIGRDVLYSYQVFFDYADRTLYIKPDL